MNSKPKSLFSRFNEVCGTSGGYNGWQNQSCAFAAVMPPRFGLSGKLTDYTTKD